MGLLATFQVVGFAAVQTFGKILVTNGLLLLTCNPNPNGIFTVQSFPNIQCPWGKSTDTQEFMTLLGPCLVYNAFFTLALPLGFNYFAWRGVVESMHKDHEDRHEDQNLDRGKWGIFCDAFRDSHVHWMLVVVCKDLLLNILTSLLVAFDTEQNLLCSAICTLYAVLTITEQPYKHQCNNAIEVLCSLCVAMSLVILATPLDALESNILLCIIQVFGIGGPVAISCGHLFGSFKNAKWMVPHGMRPVFRFQLYARVKLLVKWLGTEDQLEKAFKKLDDVDLNRLDHLLSSSPGLADMIREPPPSWVPMSHMSTARFRWHSSQGKAASGSEFEAGEPSQASIQLSMASEGEDRPKRLEGEDSEEEHITM